jgi:hypothetical protein
VENVRRGGADVHARIDSRASIDSRESRVKFPARSLLRSTTNNDGNNNNDHNSNGPSFYCQRAREQRRGGFSKAPAAPAPLYGLTRTATRKGRGGGVGWGTPSTPARRKEHNNNGEQIPPMRYAQYEKRDVQARVAAAAEAQQRGIKNSPRRDKKNFFAG